MRKEEVLQEEKKIVFRRLASHHTTIYWLIEMAVKGVSSRVRQVCPRPVYNPRRKGKSSKVRRATPANPGDAKPVFIVKECGKTHYVTVRARGSNKTYKLVQDTGSENSYIDLTMANAWGLMRGRTPLVPHQSSATVDSNGTRHASVRLSSVPLEIKCPDGVFRGSSGPVEVNLDQETNRFGRLYGVGHMRTLRKSVRYITDFTSCR